MGFQDEFITANNLSIHYIDWGNVGAPSMLLIHGLCGNAHYWDSFAKSMKKSFHVLAIDQRGHGDSEWAHSYGPRDYILDLEDFVAKLGLSEITLIGHSIGGINATVYAARHPDQIAKLVVIDIGPDLGTAGVERMQKQWKGIPEAFSSVEQATSYLKKAEPRYSDDFIHNQAQYSLRQNGQGKFEFKYDMALHRTNLSSPVWLWEYIEQIICPTLVVHGIESDMLLPETAKQIGDTLLYGNVVDIVNAGHSVPGDNPEAFELAVREFLRVNIG